MDLAALDRYRSADRIMRKHGWLPHKIVLLMIDGEFEGVPFEPIDPIDFEPGMSFLTIREGCVSLETLKTKVWDTYTSHERKIPVEMRLSLPIRFLID